MYIWRPGQLPIGQTAKARSGYRVQSLRKGRDRQCRTYPMHAAPSELVKIALPFWSISRYELQPDRIVFYLWSWRAEGSRFSFRFTPRYAIRAKAVPATLFDYYNPDLKVVLAPQRFQVTDSFRR